MPLKEATYAYIWLTLATLEAAHERDQIEWANARLKALGCTREELLAEFQLRRSNASCSSADA